VTINLVEVNKAPSFTQPIMAMSVDENAAPGTAIDSLVATDPNTHGVIGANAARTDTLTYSWADGTSAPFFSLNAGTGAITVASGANLDYELAPTYTFSVVVRDSNWDTVNVKQALSATGSVVISLRNKNDAPTTSDPSYFINENSGSATAIGTVSAADQDIASSAQTLSFALSRTTSSVCWAFTSIGGAFDASSTQIVPLPLQAVTPAASTMQTVYARVQSLAVGGTAYIVLSSAAVSSTAASALAADRYVISLSSGRTVVQRCTV